MPKGFNKTAKSHDLKYVFHVCNCGWECMIDNVADEKRAVKLKQMRVRQHNKRCPDRGKKVIDLGSAVMKMNGSYICGDPKAHLHGTKNMRELIKDQFNIDLAK